MSECIIQLTDLHLLSDVEACVREVPTWRTLKQVLDLLRQQDQQDYERLYFLENTSRVM